MTDKSYHFILFLAIGLCLMLGGLFQPVWSGGKSLYYRDVQNFHYPIWKMTADEVRQGHLPLWNPRIHFGLPVLGNPNYLLWYPPAWIRFILDPWLSFHLFVAGHLLLGGLAFFGLGRAWRIGPAAAGWGALAYTCSGVCLSTVHIFLLVTYVLLAPLTLWALEKVIERGTFRSLAGLALCGAALITVFEPLMAAGLMLLAGGRVLAALWPLSGAPGRWPLVGRLAVAVVAAGLLAGPVLVEGTRLLGQTGRAGTGVDRTYAQPPALTLELFFPNPLGFNFDDKSTYRGNDYHGGRDPYFLSIFAGLGPLLLILAGFSRRGMPRRFAWPLAVGTALLCMLAWGPFIPVWRDLLTGLPVLGWGRYSQKYVFYLSFIYLLLATAGMDRAWQPPEGAPPPSGKARTWPCLAIPLALVLLSFAVPGFSLAAAVPWTLIAVALVGMAVSPAFAGVMGARARRHLAGCCVVAELLAGNMFVMEFAPREQLTEPAGLLSKITARDPAAAGYRVAVEPMLGGGGGVPADAATYMLYLREAGYPYFGMIQGIHYAFDLNLDRMHLARMSRLRDSFFAADLDRKVAIMERSGTRYLVSPGLYRHSGLEIIHCQTMEGAAPHFVYRLKASPARLSFSRRLAPARPDTDFLDCLGPAPLQIEGEADPGPSGDAPAVATAAGDDIRISRAASTEVAASATVAAPGVLVLRETACPGWTVAVDGDARPLLRVDGVFMGVSLAPGTHEVVFSYRPAGFHITLWISLCVLAGILLGCAGTAIRRPTRASPVC